MAELLRNAPGVNFIQEVGEKILHREIYVRRRQRLESIPDDTSDELHKLKTFGRREQTGNARMQPSEKTHVAKEARHRGRRRIWTQAS